MRVHTFLDHTPAEFCPHWSIEDQDEPRALDDYAMHSDEFYDQHPSVGTEYELTVCLLSPAEIGIYAWCEAAQVWEPVEDHRHYCLGRTVSVTHRCPPRGRATMPCCGRTPFEAPRTDRITTDPEEVTCHG